MWSDPDAYFRIINGPEGESWYSEGENAYITDQSLTYLKENNGQMNGWKNSDGEETSLWNTSFCVNTGETNSWQDGKGNHRIGRTTQWEEVMEITGADETYEKWKKTTGHENWQDWLSAEGAYYSESTLNNLDNFLTQPDDSMQLTLDAVRDVVVNASWKMVYAADENEFNKIWAQMVADCQGLHAQEIIDYRLGDIEKAKSIRDSLSK